MKTFLSILLVLITCGCTSLDSLVRPPADQTLVAADTLLDTAEINIDRFLKHERRNRTTLDNTVKSAATGLRERYKINIADLRADRAKYANNRTDANRTKLLLAMELVRSDEGIAASYLNGQAIPGPGHGYPFAPPLPPLPQSPPQPVFVPTIDLTPFETRMGNLERALAAQRALLKQHGITNIPPPPPPAPPSP